MAGTWHGKIKIETTSNVCRFAVRESAGPVAGIILRGMVVNAAGGLSDTTYFARSTASSIGGYRKLLTANSSPVQTYSCSVVANIWANATCTIEEFATDAGVMDGVTLIGAASAVQVTKSWYTKVATRTTPSVKELWTEAYHRTSGGSETFLQRTITSLTLTETVRTPAAQSFAERTWTTDERLVLKFKAHFEGVPEG